MAVCKLPGVKWWVSESFEVRQDKLQNNIVTTEIRAVSLIKSSWLGDRVAGCGFEADWYVACLQ